jgi:hypothetical protein
MTKQSVAPKDSEQHQQIAEQDYADKYAGEETYVDREQTITPRASILQGLSPQVKRNNVAYVEGATPGMIHLSSYHQPLIDGDKGIIFQPCLFQVAWEVRTPKERDGAANYVDQFAEPQPTWEAHRAEKGNFVFYKTPEGNNANLVHLHIGLIHIGSERLPYAIKFAGTGMFISKQFNGLVGGRRTDSGKPAARFTYTYRMRVKSQNNAAGEWGQWAISPEGKATPDEQDLGHQLVQAFKENRATVERDMDVDHSSGGGEEQPM